MKHLKKLFLFILVFSCVFNAMAGLSFRRFVEPGLENTPQPFKRILIQGDVFLFSRSETALHFYQRAMNFAEKEKNAKLKIIAGNFISKYYSYNNQHTLALNHLQQALSLAQQQKQTELEITCLINMGITAAKQTAFTQSATYLKRAEKLCLKTGNRPLLFKVKENSGLNYMNTVQLNYKLADALFYESYTIAQDLKDTFLLAVALKNLSGSKLKLERFDEALALLKPVPRYLQQYRAYDELGDCYAILGDIFYYMQQPDSALGNYTRAYEYKKLSANNDESAILATDIAYMYAEKKDAKNFMAFYNESLTSIRASKNFAAKEYIYRWLGNIQEQLGNYEQALALNKMHFNVVDSLGSAAKLEEFSRLSSEKDYEIEREKARIENEKKIDLEKAETQRADKMKRFFMLAFVLALVAGFFIFKEYRTNKKQKEIIQRQKQLVDEKNKEITDSINYAKRIQDAILPSGQSLVSSLKKGFVLFKPKDVVSGDFYWLEKAEQNNTQLVLFAAADCTGHGVPGAMVSVICSNALSKAVLEENITEPGKLLDRTRELVIQRFAKSGGEMKDGMDISLCCLDAENKTLQWSGANNPLWHIRRGVLTEYKPNKQPIGHYANAQPFTTHTIALETGDTVYVLTDGYQDQFGGEKGKKFKASAMKDLLVSIQAHSMDAQKEMMIAAFEKWRGDMEQVDDICIIGIKI